MRRHLVGRLAAAVLGNGGGGGAALRGVAAEVGALAAAAVEAAPKEATLRLVLPLLSEVEAEVAEMAAAATDAEGGLLPGAFGCGLENLDCWGSLFACPY